MTKRREVGFALRSYLQRLRKRVITQKMGIYFEGYAQAITIKTHNKIIKSRLVDGSYIGNVGIYAHGVAIARTNSREGGTALA